MAQLALSTLIPLDQADSAEVEHVRDRAFGTDRHGRTAYTIRAGTEWLPGLSFAALDESDVLAGTIQAWPVALTDSPGRAHPLIMVGPVAILPERQGQGFGRALMAAQAGALDPAAPLPQVLIGDEPYYGQFGFTEAPRGWRCPGPWQPERLLVRTLNAFVLPLDGVLGPWLG
jgi:predicted N-acetyltransferase YhbS